MSARDLFFTDIVLTPDGWELDPEDQYEFGWWCRLCGRAWKSQHDRWYHPCGHPTYAHAQRARLWLEWIAESVAAFLVAAGKDSCQRTRPHPLAPPYAFEDQDVR